MSIYIEDFKKKFDSMVYQRMVNGNIAGCSFTMFKDQNIFYSRGFGSRNLEAKLPYTPDTLSGYTSGAKSFTALAILLLQQQGKLSIEDTLSKYLPITVGRNGQPIKIKHLLSHSSGIPDLGAGESDVALFDNESGLHFLPLGSWEDIFQLVNEANSEILFNPGEHFYYFNTGYILLGEIIHRVSGLPYPDFIKKHITSKLGMDRTGFLESSYEPTENISRRYMPKRNSEGVPYPKPVADKDFDEFIFGAGGLYSSTTEIASYTMMMNNGGKYNGEQVFSSEIIKELTTGRIKSNIYTDWGDVDYCYGWLRINNFLGDTLMLHGGAGIGTITQMAYLQNAKIGIVASSNGGPLPNNEVIDAFFMLLGKKREDEFPYIKRINHLQTLTGMYSSYKGVDKIKILFEGGKLYWEESGNREPIYPKTESLEELNYYLQKFSFKMDIQFVIDENKEIHIVFDRWVYHKVAQL